MKFLIVFLAAVAAVGARVLQFNDIKVEGRITNGENDKPGVSPFQALLILDNRIMCGASVLTTKHIMTAAHCTDGIQRGIVQLGSTDMNAPSVVRQFTSNNVVLHPDWDARNIRNDISIIRVLEFIYTLLIQPVQLPSTNEALVGETVTATGWGRTSDTGTGRTNYLQTVDLNVISNGQCRRYFPSLIQDSMICTLTSGGKSTCNGDSGGPLVRYMSNEQVGIVSFGSIVGCAKGYPAVFTRVSFYTPWIKSVLAEL